MADSGDSTQSESEPFRPITPIHSPVMLPPCRICSEKASGFHYGANTCEACKGFFRRSLKKKREYTCAIDGNCGTLYGKRNACIACRLKKCIESGISKSAIRTGRYTYENKTKIIKEVKQLERARLGSSPSTPSPPEGVVALCSRLPPQILENKYDITIDHILAAYHKNSPFTDVLFENIQEMEETYLEKKRLYDNVFGSLKPVSDEEYITIYESTGLDIDGRLERIEQMIPLVEVGIRNYIAFVKKTPGFRSLPPDDQVALFKRSRHEMFTILCHKTFNHELGLVTFFWGDTIDMEQFSTHHSAEFIKCFFSMSFRIQKLNLCKTETIILSCIALFFTDRCRLKCPDQVETIQRSLIEAFSYFLKKNHPDDPFRLARCLLLFPELRSIARLFLKEEEKFTLMWNDKVQIPPLLCEIWAS